MDRLRGIFDNLLANLVWAVIAAIASGAWAVWAKEPPHRVALMALVAAAVVVFLLNEIRGRRSALTIPITASAPRSGTIEQLGRSRDGRAYLRVGSKVVELDTDGDAYLQTRDVLGVEAIARGVAVGSRFQFGEADLRRMVDGDRVLDEGVYVAIRHHLNGPTRTKFWTRSVFDALSERDQERVVGDGDFRFKTWVKGTHPAQVYSTASGLLREGSTMVMEHLADDGWTATQIAGVADSTSPPLLDIREVGQARTGSVVPLSPRIYNPNALPIWLQRVKAHVDEWA